MNTDVLARVLANEIGVSIADSKKIIKSLTNIIIGEVAKGTRVKLTGFGIFFSRQLAGRMARNPKNDAPVKVPAKRVARFKAGKLLKEKVAKARVK